MKRSVSHVGFPLFVLLALLLASGCMTPQTGSVYSRQQAQQSLNIHYGKIINIRPATIKANNSGLGAVIGGVAGGVAGSTIGHGTGSTLAAVGGALAGAAAGAAVENEVGTKAAWEFTVQLDDGRVVAVVQEQDPESNYLRVGDRVELIESRDGTLRLRR